LRPKARARAARAHFRAALPDEGANRRHPLRIASGRDARSAEIAPEVAAVALWSDGRGAENVGLAGAAAGDAKSLCELPWNASG